MEYSVCPKKEENKQTTKKTTTETQVMYLRVNSSTNVSIVYKEEMLNIQSPHGLYYC